MTSQGILTLCWVALGIKEKKENEIKYLMRGFQTILVSQDWWVSDVNSS